MSPMRTSTKKFLERRLTGVQQRNFLSTQNLPSITDSDQKVSRPKFSKLKTDAMKIRPAFSPRVERKKGFDIR